MRLLLRLFLLLILDFIKSSAFSGANTLGHGNRPRAPQKEGRTC